jgi:hypothetical protein
MCLTAPRENGQLAAPGRDTALGRAARVGGHLDDRPSSGCLDTLVEVTQRAGAFDVRVIVEGPGHVPFHLVREDVERQQEPSQCVPFYPLGPGGEERRVPCGRRKGLPARTQHGNAALTRRAAPVEDPVGIRRPGCPSVLPG